jgi:hypothetical protein
MASELNDRIGRTDATERFLTELHNVPPQNDGRAGAKAPEGCRFLKLYVPAAGLGLRVEADLALIWGAGVRGQDMWALRPIPHHGNRGRGLRRE